MGGYSNVEERRGKMNTPNILYYTRLDNSTERGKKTPRYTIAAQAGYYPPMEQLRGRNGLVSMFLLKQDREDSSSTPPLKLQAKNGLNFTGLKDYWIEGVMSGLAYGYPYGKPTYSSKNKPNPFFDYKDDGFLFIIHCDEKDPSNIIPTSIELIVLEGAKVLISAYCKMLSMGGFDEALAALREQARKSQVLV